MKTRSSDAIRQLFLDYFAQHGHRVVASHALLPPDDPTLLFVNAGMVQFKEVFAGRRSIGATRAVSAQKCLRVSGKHNDLENVGRTARHHTFFEMLGNFSFGDYFKREAITLAWRLLTDPDLLGLDPDKLWVTVHPDDEEARAVWIDVIGVPAERVVDDETNFWAMGETGPCGPCSEIHIDQGPALSGGRDVPFGDEGDRYLELWNLVFMQYERQPDGSLVPLPRPSIDTGMGLERIAAIVQGKMSNYDTDLFAPLIARVEALSGRRYGGRYAQPGAPPSEDVEQDVAFRVIADHARATAFLVADGVYPDNEGRGYVLRRIMRRAIRFGLKLGLQGPFLHAVCAEVVARMGKAYPELEQHAALVARLVRQEEERFGRTLQEGMRLLDDAIAEVQRAGASTLPGHVVFTLYDTHGFPVDLTALVAAEKGLTLDMAGFERHMAAQRARGRASWKAATDDDEALIQLAEGGATSVFVGHDALVASGRVLAIVRDGQLVGHAEAGQTVHVVCDRTPFYAEAGGQIGDRGRIEAPGGHLTVVDTQRQAGLVVHVARVDEGAVREGDRVELTVDAARREPTRKNHSGTHLMHWALREVLGDHVRQRGSLVEPERLRFDFSHFGPLRPEEIEAIEQLVNERITGNHDVRTEEMAYDEAIARGALAFFGDRYGDRVRVVTMAESMELCGGTHVRRTGDIGLFKIVQEGSISSGVRRVEALSGPGALAWVQAQAARIERLAARLRCGPAELERRLERMLREMDALRLEADRLRARLDRALSRERAAQARRIGDVRALATFVDGVGGKALRALGDRLLGELGSGVVMVGSRSGDKASLLVAVTADLQERIDAGDIVRELAPIIGGRGGGKRHLAQAGGRRPEALPDAERRFYEIVREMAA